MLGCYVPDALGMCAIAMRVQLHIIEINRTTLLYASNKVVSPHGRKGGVCYIPCLWVASTVPKWIG